MWILVGIWVYLLIGFCVWGVDELMSLPSETNSASDLFGELASEVLFWPLFIVILIIKIVPATITLLKKKTGTLE